MFRTVLTLLCAAAALSLPAQEPEPGPRLHGDIQGRTYVSPTGAFKVSIPVLPELGGNVTDTPNVVTFQDEFNVHVSIAAFPQDATQRWELSTRGMQDYLAYFFGNFVLPDFRQTFPGIQIESAKFVPGLLDGALISYLLIPGGTMFASRILHRLDNETLPVAKRGNLAFVRSGHIFVVSIELAERVIEGSSYKKTTAEEDAILKQRLEEMVSRIQFTAPSAASGPATRK